jgi:ATP-dependent RNA circularization protein (DNA/RNA ligase family)
MLIESNQMHDRITYLMNEAEDSQLNFSTYKAVIGCLKHLRSYLTEIEIMQDEKNKHSKYAELLKGTKDKDDKL